MYRRTVAPACLPMKMPLYPTLVWFLLLDRLAAPGWVWGVMGAVLAAVWVGWIHHMCCDAWVDLPGLGHQNERRKD